MQRLNGKWLSCLLIMAATLSACTLPAPARPAVEAPPVAPVVEAAPVAPVIAAPALPAQQQPQPTVAVQSSEIQPIAENPLTPEQTQLLAGLPSKGAAPELTNEVWFNSVPLKLADLRGKVVMIEFWTFG